MSKAREMIELVNEGNLVQKMKKDGIKLMKETAKKAATSKYGPLTTNKEVVFETFEIIRDYEEILKEMKFQANHAKRDPDESALAFMNALESEFYKLERLTKKSKKILGL